MRLHKMLIVFLKRFEKRTLVESFQEEDSEITFNVVDYTNPLYHWSDTRRLIFQNGGTYSYSTIFLNKLRHDQPINPAVHQLTHSYLPKLSCLENALVLGCAGCSIPRFLALSAPNCKITGIEYSEKMVEIAQKYFVNDPTIFRNFQLIHADAFSYIHNLFEMYHLLYVDLFLADKIHPQIFTDEFICDLNSRTAKESIIIINLLSLSKDSATQYMLRFMAMFSAAYVFNERTHYYGVLIKTENSATLKRFEAKAVKHIRMEERFVSSTLNT